MSEVKTGIHHNPDGPVVALWLSGDAIAMEFEDTPVSGVALSPQMARDLANRLIELAHQIDPQG